mmetsp:Transcript_107851/g.300716  ORF Transcript_107851/g.300716 Transcript_107851/m.300716 type:complete len:141 (-) Transcript_107851:213-635(-)
MVVALLHVEVMMGRKVVNLPAGRVALCSLRLLMLTFLPALLLPGQRFTMSLTIHGLVIAHPVSWQQVPGAASRSAAPEVTQGKPVRLASPPLGRHCYCVMAKHCALRLLPGWLNRLGTRSTSLRRIVTLPEPPLCQGPDF